MSDHGFRTKPECEAYGIRNARTWRFCRAARKEDRISTRPSQAGLPEPLRARLASGDPLRVLSLDGGGFLGLASAAFIDGIEQHFDTTFHREFDLFCGTSTGAIIALSLAFGLSGSKIVKLYEQLGAKVFVRRARGLFRSRYGNEALRDELKSVFDAATLGDLLARSKTVLITAFNVTTGSPRLFKTDHSEDLSRDALLPLTDIAMASSAAPTYFPVVRITNPRDKLSEVFCDGGVVANHPALLGYAEALSYLRVQPVQIHLLSISTPRTEIGEGVVSTRSLSRGFWQWRKTLPSILIDSNARVAHEVLRRIAASYPEGLRPRYERIEMANNDRFEMDDVSSRATQTLKHLGTTTAAHNDVRRRVQGILGVR